MLYNNILIVNGGHKKLGGGDRIDPSCLKRSAQLSKTGRDHTRSSLVDVLHIQERYKIRRVRGGIFSHFPHIVLGGNRRYFDVRVAEW